MATSPVDAPLEAKAHELIGQLNSGKLAAVVHLLEVMVSDEEDEEISAEEAAAVARSKEWFKSPTGASAWTRSARTPRIPRLEADRLF